MLCLKQQLPRQWIHNSSFLEKRMWNSPEIIHFETWVWSWYWTWTVWWTWGPVFVHTRTETDFIVFCEYIFAKYPYIFTIRC